MAEEESSNKIFLLDSELLSPRDFTKKADVLSTSSNEDLTKLSESIIDRKVNAIINYEQFETFCMEERIMDEELLLLKIRQGRVAVNPNSVTAIQNLKNTLYNDGWVFFSIRSYIISIDSLDEEIRQSYIDEFVELVEINQIFRDIFLEKNIVNNETEKKRFARKLFYFYKYVFLKNFFYENSYKFIPDYDMSLFDSSDKRRVFLDSVMKEFDKFAEAIDKLSIIQDINETPDYLLEYLSQLVGYERDSGNVSLTNLYFRELVKSIVDIYKIKGTIFAYELFFNFVGFEIEIKEYWFDRRFFKSNLDNPFTEAVPRFKTDPRRYLSFIKPSLYYLSDVFTINKDGKTVYEIPGEEDFIKSNSLSSFDLLLEYDKQLLEEYPNIDERVGALLYGNISDPKKQYTYFKTNFVSYKIKRNIGLSDVAYTQDDNAAVQVFINFLTPIFINRSLEYIPRPLEEFFGWQLKDAGIPGKILKAGVGYMNNMSTNSSRIFMELQKQKLENEQEGEIAFLYSLKHKEVFHQLEKNLYDLLESLKEITLIRDIEASKRILDKIYEIKERIIKNIFIKYKELNYNIDKDDVLSLITYFYKDLVFFITDEKRTRLISLSIIENGINLYGDDIEKLNMYLKDKLLKSLSSYIENKIDLYFLDYKKNNNIFSIESKIELKNEMNYYLQNIFYYMENFVLPEEKINTSLNIKPFIEKHYFINQKDIGIVGSTIFNKDDLNSLIKENSIDNMVYSQSSIQDYVDYTEGPFLVGQENLAGAAVYSEQSADYYYLKNNLILDKIEITKNRFGQ